ncbi:MAG: Gfo/Idh/MocA family oxidoreductase [Chloroflexi bacterium]|nr:Gfo/Idh/MocA family oxidoreductase [Chloroflexota bacterium]
MATMMQAPRIAVIGCGAIAEMFYLPALARFPAVIQTLVLVDSNPKRLQELGERFNVGQRVQYYDEIAERVDGAIVALPHQLHYRVSMDFLGRGAHVLCEKPLAESASQAQEMIAQSERAGVTLAVNNTRRLFPAYSKVKELIAQGEVGEPVALRYVDGERFNWPTASGFYFKGRKRGVLFDRGAHGLDAICWWLGGKPNLVKSENDSFGGVEGVASVEFERGKCRGQAHFNWLNKLENRYCVVGESGAIESGIEDWWALKVKSKSGKAKLIRLTAPEKTYNDFATRLVANFIDVVEGRAQPLVPARAVLDSLEFIDECYQRATRYWMPWYDNWESRDGG